MAFLGGMVAHTPFAYLNEQYGWRNSLLIDGFLGMILLVWIGFIIKDRPPFEEQALLKPTQPATILSILGNLQTWLGGLYTSLLNLPIMVLCALWGASYLKQVHHLSEISASNIVSLIFIGSMIGCPLAGWLSDTQGRRKPIMIIGALGTLLLVFPLVYAGTLSSWVLGILFFALGLLTSTQVVSYPLIAESNAENHTGVATGLASILIMGGAGVAQVLFGLLMQQHSGLSVQNYTTADYQYAMWIFPLAAFIGLIAVLFMRETYCKRLN